MLRSGEVIRSLKVECESPFIAGFVANVRGESIQAKLIGNLGRALINHIQAGDWLEMEGYFRDGAFLIESLQMEGHVAKGRTLNAVA